MAAPVRMERNCGLIFSMASIFLVRHGESEANIGCSDDPNCDLTDRGVQQAKDLGAQLAAGTDLAGFVGLVSPYRRARRTAQAISDATGLAFTVEPQIREWGKDCTIDGSEFRSETREQLIERMHAFHNRIGEGKFVLVSHAAPIAALMLVATGGPVELRDNFWEHVGNCCLLPLR
jgi:broad specificity phosphatase PhoE